MKWPLQARSPFSEDMLNEDMLECFPLAIIICRHFILYRNVFLTPLGTDGALVLLYMVTAAFLLLFLFPFRLSSPF